MARTTGLLILLLLTLDTARSIAELRDTTNAADYLIVTTSGLIQEHAWISELADWRDSHGRSSMIVATEEIWNEFGDGVPSDTVLKEFLFYVHDHWQPPRLRDVFLIGHHDVIPSHVDVGIVDTAISDFFFAGDPLQPGPARFNVGRLPWSPAQGEPLLDYASKVIAYETATPGLWQQRVQLIADHPFNLLNWVTAYCEPLIAGFPDHIEVERDYMEYPPGDPWHGDRDEILENLNAGALIAAYFGLGGDLDSSSTSEYWSDSLRLGEDDFGTLTNGPRLPVVISIQYEISRDEVSPVPWSLVANPGGGAIAYFAVSGFSYVFETYRYREAFFATALDSHTVTVGDVWRLTAATEPGSLSRNRTFLLGDPGLRLPDRISDVDDRIPEAVPTRAELLGNYPNPFNPSTTIRYALPRVARVSLRVYDVNGREVSRLVEGVRPSGEHEVRWTASGSPSSVYLVVLRSEGTRAAQKMILLK